MKILVSFGIIAILGYFAYGLLKPDEYIGFFYPNASDLTIDVMSQEKFESVYDCRAWAESMALEQAETVLSHGNGWDYECGLNCDLSGGKPYVCEETVQ